MIATDRIAPEGGYANGAKAQYRRMVWKTLIECCPVSKKEARAILMPSIEGHEIEVALSKGLRESNLFIVDKNPAIVAILKRRYPRINTIGLELKRISERIELKSIHLANFDLCSNITSTEETLQNAAGVIADDGIVAVTMLRGRELNFDNRIVDVSSIILDGDKRFMAEIFALKTPGDLARMLSAAQAITRKQDRVYHAIRYHIYPSSSGYSTMLVGIYWILDKNYQDESVDPESLAVRIKRTNKIASITEKYYVGVFE